MKKAITFILEKCHIIKVLVNICEIWVRAAKRSIDRYRGKPVKLYMGEPAVRLSLFAGDDKIHEITMKNPSRTNWCLVDILSTHDANWNEEVGTYRLEYWDITKIPAERKQTWYTYDLNPNVKDILTEYSVF